MSNDKPLTDAEIRGIAGGQMGDSRSANNTPSNPQSPRTVMPGDELLSESELTQVAGGAATGPIPDVSEGLGARPAPRNRTREQRAPGLGT